MLAIQDSRIFYDGSMYVSCCPKCNSRLSAKTKASIRRTLGNGYCRKCTTRYNSSDVPKNSEGKWVSHCPKCGKEQAYTRPDHAKSSERQGWTCKSCSNRGENNSIGSKRRLYNKFKKSAGNRKIYWGITFKEFVGCYTGSCALTGWDLTMDYGNCTASFDRIDSKKPYELGNIQWVHTMVNMCKNKHSQEKFISMCKAVADKAK